jgi:flagellin-like protein
MKKIWKIRKDSEAVSPVIATILMVAITVVLAAVLYVMVMGFGGPSTQTPTGSFTQAQATSASAEKLQFGVITPNCTFSWLADSFSVVENNPVGVCVLGPPKPITMTYNTAAKTTVIATIKMVAMTGDTASESFRIFHIFFIVQSSFVGSPLRQGAFMHLSL